MPKGGPRPGAGRKRIDPEIKRLRGTARADRDGEAPPPALSGAMRAPIYLGELENLIFGSISAILDEQERASPHHADIVALLSQRLAQIQRWQAVLECSGDTYEATTAHGMIIRKRPEVQMLSDALRHAHGLLSELMLTPAAALRLGNPAKPEDNPFKVIAGL